MIALGIDPGLSNGAAVVLDCHTRPARVIDAIAWSTCTRKGVEMMRVHPILESKSATAELVFALDIFRARGLHDWLRSLPPYLAQHGAGVEWVPPGRTHGVNKEHLRECGRMIGLVEAIEGYSPKVPTPAEWRRSVFGLRSNLKGPAADAAIRARLPALVTLPPDVPAWAMKHLPDACGVALYAAMEKP